MKKVFLFFFLFNLKYQFSYSQDTLNTRHSGLVIFNFNDSNVKTENVLFKENGKSIFRLSSSMGLPTPNWVSFIKDRDTMKIKLWCRFPVNMYFDSIKFKKGNFEINFEANAKLYINNKSHNQVRGKKLLENDSLLIKSFLICDVGKYSKYPVYKSILIRNMNFEYFKNDGAVIWRKMEDDLFYDPRR
jgi:hypothetical protein